MPVTREDVSKEFVDLLVQEFSVPREAITPTAHMFDDLGLDSIDLLSAVAIVETRHGIAIPDEDLPGMLIVEDCLDKIVEHLAPS